MMAFMNVCVYALICALPYPKTLTRPPKLSRTFWKTMESYNELVYVPYYFAVCGLEFIPHLIKNFTFQFMPKI